MRKLALLLSLILGSSLVAQDEGRALADRLASEELEPLQSYTAQRTMCLSKSKSESTSMLVETSLVGKKFSYKVLSEDGRLFDEYLRRVLDEEKKRVSQGKYKEAFSGQDYNLGSISFSEGLWQISAIPKNKDDPFSDYQLFVDQTGVLVKSTYKLADPPFYVKETSVKTGYDRIYGVRLPIDMDSTAKVRLLGEYTFHIHNDYETVNGVPVTEK